MPHQPGLEAPTIGLVLAADPAPGGWRNAGTIAAEAEAAGVDAVWVTDHLFWHRPAADVGALLALLATHTSHCTLGPLVLQMPLRCTASTAKTMAFVDYLSDGRVVVGVGVGEHEAEYTAAGLADRFHVRGRLLDTAMVEMRRAWTHAGDLKMNPTRELPIWVGGRSERARARSVALGDGWIPHLCSLHWYREQMILLSQDLESAGREGDDFTRGVSLAIAVDEVEPSVDPLSWLGELYSLPPDTFGRRLIRGSAQEVVEQILEFHQAGADHLAILVAGNRVVDHITPLMQALRSA